MTQVCAQHTSPASQVLCSPLSQQSPTTHRPSQHNSPSPHGCASSQVGQQGVPRSQPELSSPSSVWVRQKIALPELAPAKLAPVTSASTKQVLLRFALRKLALVRIERLTFALLRLAPLRLTLARF
jgi:hypothetical protein